MLELRPNCELCDVDLPPESPTARICTYECTFCADCVATRLRNVCPNCGGDFAPRPIRPATAYRPGLSRNHQVPTETRTHCQKSRAQIEELVARLESVPPSQR